MGEWATSCGVSCVCKLDGAENVGEQSWYVEKCDRFQCSYNVNYAFGCLCAHFVNVQSKKGVQRVMHC